MNSPATIVLFYALLGLATLILRGDLSDWPRWADRGLSFAVAFSAVVLLLKSWRASHPPAVTSSGPPAAPSPNWPWWAGVVGFLGFIYLAALPPVSTWLAQPQRMERSSAGRDAIKPGETSRHPITSAPTPSLAGGESEASGPSTSAGTGLAGSSALDRLRGIWREKPSWLRRLGIAAALVLLAVIIWVLWRLLRPRKEPPIPPPGQQPLWYEEAHAPRYVREFARLCERLGCPPRPGETFRDLLARLSRAGRDVIALMPMTAYHYRVRYENASPDRTAERAFSRMLRALRKAPISAPAIETAPAASAAH